MTKNEFVVNVWPANSALYIDVSTHCIETVNQLDYNRYLEMTRWSRGYASELGARGPGINSWLWQGVLYLIFCFVVVVFYLSRNFAIPYAILIHLACLLYCKNCDRF